MKRIIAVALAIILLTSGQVSNILADAPEMEWDRTFSRSGSFVGSSVYQTTDGGYVITGFTESYGFGLLLSKL